MNPSQSQIFFGTGTLSGPAHPAPFLRLVVAEWTFVRRLDLIGRGEFGGAAALVEDKVSVIVVFGEPAARAAQRATHTIPIIAVASDLVASDLIYPNRSGETYSVTYNPNHRWFYFPDMTPDEALLLKCYDSTTDGRTRFGPHTAFVDPTTPADAAPRESIELRTLVFHRQ